jgi:hypothetical protein
MSASQVQTEGFCSFHELAQVGVSAEQVVDELTTQRFLATNHLATCLGMAVCERRHGVVDYLEHSLRCRPHRLVVALADHRRELGPHTSSRG